MKLQHFVALGLAFALLTGIAQADKTTAVKSGPQVGEELAGPFHPLNINGSSAGKKACLYCSNGGNPVAMVFARESTPELTKLIKKLDVACEKNSSAKMGSFVVFCSSDEALEGKLKTVAKKEKLKNVVLSIDNPAGPEGYNVNKAADVTVILYVDRTCKANFTFKKGELTEKKIEEVLKAVPKILTK